MFKSIRRLQVWMVLFFFVLTALFCTYRFREEQWLESIRAMSWVIAGHSLVIDPGHGGEDPGKVGPSGVYEKDINLAVARKLNAIILQGGGQVLMTRETDQALSSGQNTVRERKRADLNRRIEIAEQTRADLFISLHCNAFPSGRWYGAQTFYNPHVAGSKELAEYIQIELAAHLGNTTRKPKEDTTSVIFKKAQMPIVNVEMGFLSNPGEEKLLQDPAYQDKIAWAIYAGLVRYLAEYGGQYQSTMINVEK